MKCTDFLTLKKKFQEKIPLLTLILSKEPQKVLSLLPEKTQTIDCERFKKHTFLEEVENFPLFVKAKYLYLPEADLLTSSDLEVVLDYCKKPNPWIHLFIGANGAPKWSKIIDENGIVFHLSEKPWEIEKRLIDDITERAHQEGINISSPVAKKLASLKDEAMIHQELEKLFCYIDQRKEITLNDLEAVTLLSSHETLWNLGESVLKSDFQGSCSIMKELLEEMQIIPLVAHLKSQMRTALEMFISMQGGTLEHDFPYLKGAILEKKRSILKNYGKERLKKALMILMEGEMKAKSSHSDPSLLLEMILYKLCHSTSSPIS